MDVFFENKLFKTLSYKSHCSTLVFKVHLLRKQITKLDMLIHENNFLYFYHRLGARQYPNLLPFTKFINFTNKKSYEPLPPNANQMEDKLSSGREYLAVGRQQIHTTLVERLE